MGMLVTRTVTVAKFLYSGFDPDLNLFRRKLVGADGRGYDFLRPVAVDRESEVVENAVASDLREWLRENPIKNSSVVAFTPRFNFNRAIKWLPQIRVARVSRSYWKAERQHIYTRVIDEDGATIKIYTPARLIGQLLHAFDTTEVDARAYASAFASDEDFSSNDASPK